MSHALRHEPQSYNLNLDKQGWVLLYDLVIALNSKGIQVDKNDICKMVELSEKRRYQSMTALSKPASWLTGFGSGISYGATFLSMVFLLTKVCRFGMGEQIELDLVIIWVLLAFLQGLAFYMVGQLVLQ